MSESSPPNHCLMVEMPCGAVNIPPLPEVEELESWRVNGMRYWLSNFPTFQLSNSSYRRCSVTSQIGPRDAPVFVPNTRWRPSGDQAIATPIPGSVYSIRSEYRCRCPDPSALAIHNSARASPESCAKTTFSPCGDQARPVYRPACGATANRPLPSTRLRPTCPPPPPP